MNPGTWNSATWNSIPWNSSTAVEQESRTGRTRLASTGVRADRVRLASTGARRGVSSSDSTSKPH